MSEKVISDYNGYDYKKEFWENADRQYEDQADRMAIRKLLPKRMEKFADIGGGYGRLANEYLKRAHKIYLFDYSKTELEQAKEIYSKLILRYPEKSAYFATLIEKLNNINNQ